MRKALSIGLAFVFSIIVIALGYGYWLVKSQSVPTEFWKSFSIAKVDFDEHGIPTIAGETWRRVIEAQGYVVASERLWQMDLIRRKAGGRLAEWFGPVAFEHDEEVQLQDRLAIAQGDYEELPKDEKVYCDAYASGVNQYIADHPGRWGIEYVLLGQRPEPWTCVDSLLVVLEMTDVLTNIADREADQYAWRRDLPPAWADFLFPQDHPWNRPYFGKKSLDEPAFPSSKEFLAATPISSDEERRAEYQETEAKGSNNWAWRGKGGAKFLANDPHLGNGVPGIWYAQRLRVTKDDWVVGLSIPGLPGITLGMNPALAWAFTNVGEDIDDYLLEKLSPDLRQYLARRDNGREVWQPLIRKTFQIKVKGEKLPRQVEGFFTHRGPLVRLRRLGDGFYSRQWLALKPGMLRIPTVEVMLARNLDEFDAGIDDLRLPAQNVLSMDRHGEMRYRASGTGVRRQVTGRWPQSAIAGEWLGLEAPSTRPRLKISADKPGPQFLATANERIWIDDFGDYWYGDDRKDRIDRYLSSRGDFKRADMEKLQLDTQSRFRRFLLLWLADHIDGHIKNAGVAGDQLDAVVKKWRTWDGSSRTDSLMFAQSMVAEETLTRLLLTRVEKAFLKPEDSRVPYNSPLRRAWVLATLTEKSGLEVFGLRDAEVADYVTRVVVNSKPAPYEVSNRWQGQHPFYGRVPIIGNLFAVDEIPQFGASDTVDAERPHFGPSTRLVWDLEHPENSTWILPVGESGHLGSPHYKDMQRLWFTGQRLSVFDKADKSQAWSF